MKNENPIEFDNEIPIDHWMIEMQQKVNLGETEIFSKDEKITNVDHTIAWTKLVVTPPKPGIDPVTGEIHKPEECEDCGA